MTRSDEPTHALPSNAETRAPRVSPDPNRSTHSPPLFKHDGSTGIQLHTAYPIGTCSKAEGPLLVRPYDAVERKLVIVESEAKTVRHIYGRYLTLGAIRHLKVALDGDGTISKQRVSRSGNQIGGQSLSRGALALILRNPLYIGEVRHRGERFPGLHEAIIDHDLWDTGS